MAKRKNRKKDPKIWTSPNGVRFKTDMSKSPNGQEVFVVARTLIGTAIFADIWEIEEMSNEEIKDKVYKFVDDMIQP